MFFNDIVNAGHADGLMNQMTGRQNFRTLKGTTGTDNFSGQIIGEDENKEWDDPAKSVENVDIMRKSCVRVRQSMMLLTTPILGATMRIEPASEDNIDIKIAEFVENNLFDSPFFRWDDVLSQQLTYLPFGHSILEKAYKRHKGQIWLSNLEFRKQKTVFEWDAPMGQLRQVRQTQFNVTSDRDPEPMPAEQVVLSTYEREGNNFSGFPAVRPAWINWKAKMFLIKGDMVSYERFRMGIPTIKNLKSGDLPQEAIDAVKDLRSNSEGFIGTTKDWEMGIFGDIQRGSGVIEMVSWHDHQIVFNVMGNFMTKGEGATGSFALAKAGADMFFCNVEREANRIENIWNEPSGLMAQIPQLVEFNFPGAKTPKLRIENLKFDDLDGFAERLNKYASAEAIDITDDIKRHIRETERLPLLGLEEEQLDDMANIAPTIKRINNGRPYVLQYSRGRGGRILRLQGVKKTTPGMRVAA